MHIPGSRGRKYQGYEEQVFLDCGMTEAEKGVGNWREAQWDNRGREYVWIWEPFK